MVSGPEKEFAVSDIFREVEEDVRKERLEKLWKQYGDYIIALAAVIILAVGGWQLWQRYEASQRAKAATEFTAAGKITDPAKAAAAFASLAKTAPSGYAELSKLGQANALAASGKTAEASALYKEIAAADSGQVGATARIRAAWLVADTASKTELTELLTPINGADSAWHQMAQEVLAYSDYHAGKTKEAAAQFTALAVDANAPDELRNRARAFAAFLAGGGAKEFGSVPPPVAAPAPGMPPGIAPATP